LWLARSCSELSFHYFHQWPYGGVRGYLSMSLLLLLISYSHLLIYIPPSLYIYLTVLAPLGPPGDSWCSSSKYWYLTTSQIPSQVTSIPHGYHRTYWDRSVWPYDTLWWSAVIL
jgi:hypothetical protein